MKTFKVMLYGDLIESTEFPVDYTELDVKEVLVYDFFYSPNIVVLGS